MLYVDMNNEGSQALYIPRNGAAEGSAPLLKVRNTTDHRVLEFPIVALDVRGYFFRLVVLLPEGFTAGEWEYTLTMEEGGPAVSTGLLKDAGSAIASVQYHTTESCKQYGE